MRIQSLALLLATGLLSACGGDEDKGGGSGTDEDGDGYEADVDCDDTDAAVHPDADETCNGADDDCDGTPDDGLDEDWYADADGDGYGDPLVSDTACEAPSGYVADAGDCDDADEAVNPDAAEACDGVDNDCDDQVDEDGLSTWYADTDDDGYGDDDVSTESCDPPSGYVDTAGDCDDGDASVHPGADEYCDETDSDCDGEVADDDSLDAGTWYADGDEDGYGDAEDTTVACSPPDGYAADDTDCDDADDTAYPGASETCDGADDDCDGDVDEDSTDASTYYPDDDNDGYGDGTRPATACSPPSGYEADGDDCDDADPAVNPDATETCNSVDDDCDGSTDEAGASGELTWYADDDNDGFGDPDVTAQACTQPLGYVADSTDCDDGESAAWPGATEVCDTIDNDCDGATDEGVMTTWYADDDLDGYGDALATFSSCLAPPGYVATGDDCDDTDTDVNPGADEKCNAVDDNCDGSIDGSDAVDTLEFYTDEDDDGFGVDTSVIYSCTPMSGYAGLGGDCDDDDPDVNPNGGEVCDGVDNDCDGTADGADALGASTWYTDSDEDGFGDPVTEDGGCEVPSGTVEDGTDCDDTDATVNPDAVDYCEDGDDSDCSGADSTCPAAGDLVITEIMQNPMALDDTVGEYVEIYNATDDAIELGGLVLMDGDTDSWVISEAVTVDSGGYALLARSSSAASDVDAVYSGFQLANADDEVILATYGTDGTDGDVIDEVWYDGGPGFPDPDGCSMTLDPTKYDATDNDDGDSWCEASSTFSTGDYGTPGGENDSCPWPKISMITPVRGIDAGGNEVTISGSNFSTVSSVTFDGTSASFTVDSATEITAITPAHAAGDVEVVVSNGTDSATWGFTYTGTTGHGVGWCNLQYPQTTTVAAGVDSDMTYGRVWISGVTDSPGQGSGVLAQVGYGDTGTDPSTDPSWVWSDGEYNVDADSGANDEYWEPINIPTAGVWAYAWRFSYDSGFNFLYCDYSTGSSATDPYKTSEQGTVTVY